MILIVFLQKVPMVLVNACGGYRKCFHRGMRSVQNLDSEILDVPMVIYLDPTRSH